VWLLQLLALKQLLLFVNGADSSSTVNKTINIGYLKLPSDYTSEAGAINVAIEQAQNDSLLRGYNFRYNQVPLF